MIRSAAQVKARNGASITLSGGRYDSLLAINNATIIANGVTVLNDLVARDDGTLTYSNNTGSPTFPNVYTLDSSKVRLQSVHVTNVAASGSTTDVFNSQVDGSFGVGGFASMRGGTIGQFVTVAGGGNGSFSNVNIGGSVTVGTGTGALF